MVRRRNASWWLIITSAASRGMASAKAMTQICSPKESRRSQVARREPATCCGVALVVVDEKFDWSAVGVADDEVELAAGGFDEALEGGEQHVAASFQA